MGKLSFQPGDLLISIEGGYTWLEDRMTWIEIGRHGVFCSKEDNVVVRPERMRVNILSDLELLAYSQSKELPKEAGVNCDVRISAWKRLDDT